jgi:putative peptidoglycan lipid II flippase
VAVVQLNFLVNTFLASLQPAGSLTGISLAFPLMYMPLAAIAQSIANAALPTFSAQAASGKKEELRTSLAASLRGVLLLSLPASVGLMLLRRPIVAMLYQHGEFNANSTELVAWPLLWYAAGLVAFSLVEIVSRAFYALHDTKTPVVMLSVAMLLNLGFSLGFSAWFKVLGWMPHGGLALANSLATTLEMFGLMYLMRRRLNGLECRSILLLIFKVSAAALGMSAVIWGWLILSGTLSNTVIALGGVLAGFAAYLVLLIPLRVNEVHMLTAIITNIIRRMQRTK